MNGIEKVGSAHETVLLFPFSSMATQPNWTDICPNLDVSYCKGVGENAHNNSTNSPLLHGIKLGKIIGVTWRPKGSLIGVSAAIPAANIPKSIRKSPRDAYYYIINDASNKPFVRQCREIDAK